VAKLVQISPGFWVDPDEVRYLLTRNEEGRQMLIIRWKSMNTDDGVSFPISSDAGISIVGTIATLINEAREGKP
jgi:hypothetical protein